MDKNKFEHKGLGVNKSIAESIVDEEIPKEKLYKHCFEKLCTTDEDRKYMKKYFKLMDGLKNSDLTKDQKLEKAFDQLNQWDEEDGI